MEASWGGWEPSQGTGVRPPSRWGDRPSICGSLTPRLPGWPAPCLGSLETSQTGLVDGGKRKRDGRELGERERERNGERETESGTRDSQADREEQRLKRDPRMRNGETHLEGGKSWGEHAEEREKERRQRR